MDPRLLSYYNHELQHLREMGAEFADEFPKVAGRLSLEGFECADPYVERLLEGFSFLAARIQLKLDSEFPAFTQHLLEMIYPQYLSPTPSMTVVQFEPNLEQGSLNDGVLAPRNTALISALGDKQSTPCEFRTAHDVRLWPLQVAHADFFSRDVPSIDIPATPGVRSGLHLRFQVANGGTLKELELERLPIFLCGGDQTPMRMYEQLMANTLALVVRPVGGAPEDQVVLDKSCVRRIGFDDNEALLSTDCRSFQGYRLLQEYFALPSRFLFVEFSNLSDALKRRPEATEFDVIALFSETSVQLEQSIHAGNFALHCTPAINLFPKTADRIHLSDRYSEHHVLPDRSRPLDFEVCHITKATGFGDARQPTQDFFPFYAVEDNEGELTRSSYYALRRLPRVLSEKQRIEGGRSRYTGSEVFVSLVDAQAAPYSSNLRQLGLETLCSNRDLPVTMPIGRGDTDFRTRTGLPVRSIRCLTGPTAPRPSYSVNKGETVWRLINSLSLNYLSLTNTDASRGAAALRQLLQLYADQADLAAQKQVDGVRSIVSRPVVRRAPQGGPIVFARGVQIRLTLEELAFEGTGAFLLGAVLDEFFRQYVSINSFTETVLQTVERGEVMRWTNRMGRRRSL